MTKTECSRCGSCCDPVTVSFDPQVYAAERLASPEAPQFEPEQRRQYEFFLAHWRVAEGPYPTEEGLPGYKVTCDQYDRDTKTCLAHDTKPPVCYGFPWYGRDPHAPLSQPIARSLSPQCSFNADVRTMLPLTVIQRPLESAE